MAMLIQAGSYAAAVDPEHWEAVIMAGPWHAVHMSGKLYVRHTATCRRPPATYLGRFVADLAGLPAGRVTFADGDPLNCTTANLRVIEGARPRGRAPLAKFQPTGITRHRLGTQRPADGYQLTDGSDRVLGSAERMGPGRWRAWSGLEPGQGRVLGTGDWRAVVKLIATRQVSSCDSAVSVELAVAA